MLRTTTYLSILCKFEHPQYLRANEGKFLGVERHPVSQLLNFHPQSRTNLPRCRTRNPRE